MISVLLPTYNCANTIAQSIKSISQQTFREFELLILDDGSQDDTERIVSIINDPRIKYHKLSHQGLTKTLNYGLAVAQYDIIARMDADDLSLPHRFEKQIAVFQTLPKNYLLSSWYGVFEKSKLQYVITTPTESDEIKNGLLLHSYISHPGLMCYKDTLLNNCGYCNNAEIDAFEDYETWLKIKDKVEFAIISEVLVFQRYRKESLSNNIVYKQKIMYSIQQPYYNNLQLHFGISDKHEEYLFRGWREFFYGNKADARKYWNKLGFPILQQPRVMLAWFVTFLPEIFFVSLKELRLKFRLWYLVHYFSETNVRLRKQFASLIR